MINEVYLLQKDFGNKKVIAGMHSFPSFGGKSWFYPKAHWWRDGAIREPSKVFQKAE